MAGASPLCWEGLRISDIFCGTCVSLTLASFCLFICLVLRFLFLSYFLLLTHETKRYISVIWHPPSLNVGTNKCTLPLVVDLPTLKHDILLYDMLFPGLSTCCLRTFLFLTILFFSSFSSSHVVDFFLLMYH